MQTRRRQNDNENAARGGARNRIFYRKTREIDPLDRDARWSRSGKVNGVSISGARAAFDGGGRRRKKRKENGRTEELRARRKVRERASGARLRPLYFHHARQPEKEKKNSIPRRKSVPTASASWRVRASKSRKWRPRPRPRHPPPASCLLRLLARPVQTLRDNGR